MNYILLNSHLNSAFDPLSYSGLDQGVIRPHEITENSLFERRIEEPESPPSLDLPSTNL